MLEEERNWVCCLNGTQGRQPVKSMRLEPEGVAPVSGARDNHFRSFWGAGLATGRWWDLTWIQRAKKYRFRGLQAWQGMGSPERGSMFL